MTKKSMVLFKRTRRPPCLERISTKATLWQQSKLLSAACRLCRYCVLACLVQMARLMRGPTAVGDWESE